MINPSFSFVPPEAVGSHPRPARQATKPWFVHLVRTPLKLGCPAGVGPEERDRWLNALDIGTWPVAFAIRWPSVPSPVWRLVNRFLLDNTGVATLEHIVDAGVDTLLVCGPGRPASRLARGRASRAPAGGVRALPAGRAGRTRPLVVEDEPTEPDDRSGERLPARPLPSGAHGTAVGPHRPPLVATARPLGDPPAYERSSSPVDAGRRDAAASRTARNRAACADQVTGSPTRSPGPGGSGGRARTAATTSGKATAIGHRDRRVEVPEAGDRRGHHRPADR